MATVYVVQHARGLGDAEEVKLIGVYSSESLANEAIDRLSRAPGFADSGEFSVDPYILDASYWVDGFCTLTTLYMPLIDEGTDVWRPVIAEMLRPGGYKILGPMPDDERWQFPPGSIVDAVDRQLSGGTRMVAERVWTPPNNSLDGTRGE